MSPRLRAQSLQLLNNRTGDIHALVRIRQQPPEKAGEDREANELREELANVGLAQSHHAECPDHRNHNRSEERRVGKESRERWSGGAYTKKGVVKQDR